MKNLIAHEEKNSMVPAEMVRLLDEQAAARMLACSAALLRKWRLYGGGPAYCHIGRLVRYSQADLKEFIERGRHTQNDRMTANREEH